MCSLAIPDAVNATLVRLLRNEIESEFSAGIVDLGRGESFGFLGFDFRRIRSGRGVWRASFTPKLRNERRCCGSSKTCSAATNPNPWIG